MNVGRICFIAIILIISISTFAQPDISGDWQGNILVMGKKLKIVIHFTSKENTFKATMDIPQQGAKGLPLNNLQYKHPDIYMELLSGRRKAVFEGLRENDVISGSFKQMGIEGEFKVKLSQNNQKEETKIKPKKTAPYIEEEIEFTNGDIKFAGTLTLPKTKGKHPAIVLITGSGPQNRDEEILGMKPFWLIADHMTRKGIAVLRYDDRGVGGSTGNVSESTSQDFAQDAIAAVQFLKQRKDINPNQIGLCGHSEGGIVAPLAAAKSDDIAFIILIAGTGHSGADIVIAQTELILRAAGYPQETIQKTSKVNKKLFELLAQEADQETVKNCIRDLLREELKSQKNTDNFDKLVESKMNVQYRQLTSTWFKFFLTYDPSSTLEKVKCPVLMLFGELDLQVPAEMNRKTMVKSLQKGGNDNFQVKVFEKANHLFQEAKTGSPSEYASLKKEFLPGFLDYISEWVEKQVEIVE